MNQLSIFVGGSNGSELIDFSEEEEALVLKSWNTMKKDVATLGLKFFLRYDVKKFIYKSYFTDLHNIFLVYLRLPSADKALLLPTCEAATQLRTIGKVTLREMTLKKIGNVGISYRLPTVISSP
ncbi:Non-symbiotic hemoglobin 2 [Dendrobium catenatum]|uniref:Non-symbiotic hemoglobin 2 n=1 Tax=Dendrobium catenatum TaxID=906689 RepID=A0A2I0VIE4_9ASPA|nr:Non-symbiotic hemoglobin 2 [Dendrobium catenatum]